MQEAYAASRREARAALERAAFAQPLFTPGLSVVDLGCGPGAITLGFPVPTSTVDFVATAPSDLPFPDGSAAVAFSQGLLERLPDPAAVLTELHRVLRPGGRLALSTSDWIRARLRPRTANVDAALRGYYLLLRRAGANPFAGRVITDQVAAAGFTAVVQRTRHRAELAYRDLAAFVENALATALADPDHPDRDQLTSAARSANSWSRTAGPGDFFQCFTELTATR